MQVKSLLQMERQVLDVLAFRINSPTPYTFLRFFRHINPMLPAASSLASYLIVSALTHTQRANIVEYVALRCFRVLTRADEGDRSAADPRH